MNQTKARRATTKKTKTKTVYVVRKHRICTKTGSELGQEDYPDQFENPGSAQELLAEKYLKYHRTVWDYIRSGHHIAEARWYEIVSKKVPA